MSKYFGPCSLLPGNKEILNQAGARARQLVCAPLITSAEYGRRDDTVPWRAEFAEPWIHFVALEAARLRNLGLGAVKVTSTGKPNYTETSTGVVTFNDLAGQQQSNTVQCQARRKFVDAATRRPAHCAQGGAQVPNCAFACHQEGRLGFAPLRAVRSSADVGRRWPSISAAVAAVGAARPARAPAPPPWYDNYTPLIGFDSGPASASRIVRMPGCGNRVADL